MFLLNGFGCLFRIAAIDVQKEKVLLNKRKKKVNYRDILLRENVSEHKFSEAR